MELNWLGHACFRIRNRDTAIILDPFGPESGYTVGRGFGDAAIVTVSHNHPDHNNVSAVGGQPRVLSGPGEYEIAGILVTGVQTYHDTKKGAELGKNTAFVIEIDEVRVCHLGDLGHVPTADQVEQLGGAEVLLIPVGGGTTIDAEQAAEVISLLEPRIVVPMHYGTEQTAVRLDSVDSFLKQMGAGESAPTARLTVTRTSLPIETTVSVMEYRRP